RETISILLSGDHHDRDLVPHRGVLQRGVGRESTKGAGRRNENQPPDILSLFDPRQGRPTPVLGGEVEGGRRTEVAANDRQQFNVKLPLIILPHQKSLDGL